jgi:hypothetical protein
MEPASPRAFAFTTRPHGHRHFKLLPSSSIVVSRPCPLCTRRE